jgi:hypothetical protein
MITNILIILIIIIVVYFLYLVYKIGLDLFNFDRK